jgi:hypothetical protein
MFIDLGGPKPKYRVFGLLDAEGNVKFIGADRADKPAVWRTTIWRFRDRLNTELARWLRTLDAEPREVILLGSSEVRLHAATARAAAKILTDAFGTLKEKRTSHRRAVARAEPDGSLTIWRSQREAAKALGLASSGPIRDRIADGALLDAGC